MKTTAIMSLTRMLKESNRSNQMHQLTYRILKIYQISLTVASGSVKPAPTYYHYIYGGLELRRVPNRAASTSCRKTTKLPSGTRGA